MKCLECGADIYEGVKKCPYCKSLTSEVKGDEKFRNFDFKYTITSAEQMDKIRKTVKASSKEKKKNNGLQAKLEKMLADRRAAKRAARRAVRRGEDPKLAVQKLEAKEETNPFLKDTTVKDGDAEALNTYRRVSTSASEGKKSRVRSNSSSTNRKSNRKSVNVGNAAKRFVGIGAGLLVIALVVYLLVLLGGWLFADDVMGSYSYTKDNTLYMAYDGENITLTKNVVSEDYMRKHNEKKNPPSVDSVILGENLIHTSKDGKITYFFENYDPDTDSGRLRMIREGDVEEIITVSEAVHNSFVMSEDGERILYLRAFETDAETGVLHFWEEGLEKPLKIVADIDRDMYQLSENAEWALFIQNYRREERSGDLFAINLDEPDDGKTKIDSDVYMMFGANSDGSRHIYAKEYDPANESFDVYAVDDEGKTIRLGEKTSRFPLVQKEVDTVLILGIDDDGKDTTHNLYSVETDSGKKTKIDSGVSAVCFLSEDEETVIYEKIYNEEVSDYYAYREGELPSKIAPNIIVDYDIVGANQQFAANAECEEFLYISKFNKMKEGGTLIYCVYDGEIVSEEIVAEDVRSCYCTEDGKFVFTKNYSVTQNCFDVYVFEGGEEVLLKEEVCPDMFAVDKKGNNIYYISNYNVEGQFGILERMSLSGEGVELAKQVYDFTVSEKGDILFKKNLNKSKKTFDLYMIEEGETEVIQLNTSVGELLQP